MTYAKSIALAALVAAALVSAAVVHASGQTAAKTLADVSTVDYRAAVVADKSSGGAAPTARVNVVTYVRAGGRWQRAAARRLPGTYFWKTVTAPHAVCRFDISTAGRGVARQPGVIVQLLASPSLGCGPTATIPIPSS
ncbi:MAG TPA: hypothetical protein VH063_19610 [Gaiellaceae bacterium]|nr:hypothetical protein [Gaiellaceae bacterium]